MALIVQKYGGTVAGSPKRIKDIAERVIATQELGHQVVAVISAMEGETDRLLGLARAMVGRADGREQDVLISTGEQVAAAMLALAIQGKGYKARSWLGYQVGILTDSHFGNARIKAIDSESLKELRDSLREGAIAVVAGFQGVDEKRNITTLGRGGSDTTAVALAAELRAETCEMYTQVDGIYTGDPKTCPSAKKLKRISYEEMMEMISLGVRALHIDSIDFAMKHNVTLHLRSGFTPWEGTYVVNEEKAPEMIVSRVTKDTDQAKITIKRVVDKPGIAAKIFAPLAGENIVVDMIVQNVSQSGFTDISFTVPKGTLEKAVSLLKASLRVVGGSDVLSDSDIAKVSIIGRGMRTRAGIAAKMFQVLADKGVNIEMISTSEITVSVVVREKDATKAELALHDAFVPEQSENLTRPH